MKKNRYPKGWDDKRVRRVLRHYETQSEDAAAAEDQAAFRDRRESVMRVPLALVPAVRGLIAKHAG